MDTIIGKTINSGAPPSQRRQIRNRQGPPTVLYNFGNNQILLKREDAKDELVKRYIWELVNCL